MHRRVIVIDKADRFTAASPAGSKAGDNLPGDEEDFDALLAASSFGSRAGPRGSASRRRRCARARPRSWPAKECAPVEGDVDDAVGGLVCGLARGVVPGPTALILDGSALTLGDLATAWSGRGTRRRCSWYSRHARPTCCGRITAPACCRR